MREERLGNENILKLVVAMALPAMMTMAFQALYNAFDSIFISRWSSFDFAAISITQPVISISLAIGTGVATGMGALVSRYLGAGERRRGSAAMYAGLIMLSFLALLLTLLPLIFSKAFMAAFTSDGNGIFQGASYLRIVALAFPFAFSAFFFSFAFSSHAHSAHAMVIQSIGAVLNIILDPVFIFTLGLGARGAALATLIGHVASALTGLVLYLRSDLLRPEKSPLADNVKGIITVALPSMMIAAAGSITGLVLNRLVLSYGMDAMAIYSMYLKLESFMFLASQGIGSALIVIVSYNYGAGQWDRVRKAYFVSLFLAWSVMLLGFLFFQTCTHALVGLFTSDPALTEEGVKAFRLISFCFLLTAPNIMTSSLLQGLGRGKGSLTLTMMRFFLFLIPAAFILNALFGLSGLYLSYFAADVLVLIPVITMASGALKGQKTSAGI